MVLILNGYTITFENGQYAVNIKGANSNIADVLNVNQVSVRSFNAAGLITLTDGFGITEQDKLDIADKVWDEPMNDHKGTGSVGEALSEVEVDEDSIASVVWTKDLTEMSPEMTAAERLKTAAKGHEITFKSQGEYEAWLREQEEK